MAEIRQARLAEVLVPHLDEGHRVRRPGQQRDPIRWCHGLDGERTRGQVTEDPDLGLCSESRRQQGRRPR